MSVFWVHGGNLIVIRTFSYIYIYTYMYHERERRETRGGGLTARARG